MIDDVTPGWFVAQLSATWAGVAPSSSATERRTSMTLPVLLFGGRVVDEVFEQSVSGTSTSVRRCLAQGRDPKVPSLLPLPCLGVVNARGFDHEECDRSGGQHCCGGD